MKSLLTVRDKLITIKKGMGSMGPRLFIFLIVVVVTMILGAAAILLITGTFTAGMRKSEQLVENELIHASQAIYKEFGRLSMEAVEFSKILSASLEDMLDEKGITADQLQHNPEILEEIISKQYDRTFFFLQKSKSSGIFFILNATVNPSLINAGYSKAGLYIKNMEPNIVSSFAPNITILRGFPSIARDNSLPLHTQWAMEFNVEEAEFYRRTIQTAIIHNKLPLSKLYNWSPAFTLNGTSEEIMLCAVPLIDSKGNVLGISGFEVSAMLFKLSYMPNNNTYKRIFSTLSPVKDNALDLKGSMFAGSFSARAASNSDGLLNIGKDKRSFDHYEQEDGSSFLGYHKLIDLYPQGSYYASEKWAVTTMVPKEDIVEAVSGLNILISSMLTVLVLIGLIISFILSKRYVKPLTEGIDIIRSADLDNAPKTNIAEIDELISYLSIQNNRLRERVEEEKKTLSLLDDFVENMNKLSPAERSVFNMYVKGHTAKEAADALFLSINTIKTHNKRIYTKLNVSSREELLLYINMINAQIGDENA